MNAILGFTEMIIDGSTARCRTTLKEPLDRHPGQRPALLRLINDVLDLSKIEAGRMELALGDYSVRRRWSTSVRASLRSLAAEKGLEFDDRCAGRPSGRLRRQRAADPVPDEPGRQRAQVHPPGQRRRSASSCVGDAADLPRLRHRHRHPGRGARQRLHRVPPGRRHHHARVRRHRPRPQHHQEVRRDARRPHLGRERGRARARRSFSVRCALGEGEPHERSATILYVEDNEYNRKIVRQLLSRTPLPPDRGGRRRGRASRWRGESCPT